MDEKVRPRPAPFVDGLVRVADDEQVPVLGGQALDEVPIVQVAVLRLVHHDIIQGILPPFPGILEAVQDVFRDIDEVVEIQREMLHLPAYIAGQAGGPPLHVGNDAAGQHIGLDIAVQRLVGRDTGQELLDGLFRPFDAHLVHRILGDGLAVFLVQDGEAFREAQAINLFAEEFDAEAVDGADEVVVVAAVDHGGDALAHFGGRFVGEREAEDVGRIDAQGIDNIGITMRQGLGLACSGTGHDPDPSFGGNDGFPLSAVQFVHG